MNRDAILVTGIGGLIGRELVKSLLLDGHRVVGMDQVRPAGLSIPFLDHALPDPQRWHEAIVRFGVGRVIHAGGISGPMLLRDAPFRLCDINLGGLVGLLEAARIHNLERIVWFSSILAYGNRADLQPVPEDTPLLPTTVYGATKAAGEALVNAFYAEHGVDAISLRVASCYGPGRTTDCLIRILIEDGLAGRTTLVRDDPVVTRQHIFVGDVVAGVKGALFAPKLSQRAYNVAPGRAQSLKEIVAAVRSVVPAVDVAIDPGGMAWNTFGLGSLMVDAARRDLGFNPTTTLADGAAHTLSWVKERATA